MVQKTTHEGSTYSYAEVPRMQVLLFAIQLCICHKFTFCLVFSLSVYHNGWLTYTNSFQSSLFISLLLRDVSMQCSAKNFFIRG